MTQVAVGRSTLGTPIGAAALVLAIITLSAGILFATPLAASLWPETAAALLTVNAAARKVAGILMIGIPAGVCCALLMSFLSGALRGGRVAVAAAVVALLARALFGSVAWGYFPQP